MRKEADLLKQQSVCARLLTCLKCGDVVFVSEFATAKCTGCHGIKRKFESEDNMKTINCDPWIDRQAHIVEQIVEDMRIISGDTMGPSGVTWQDVAGTLACNLEVLARHVNKIRAGKHPTADAAHLTMLIDQLVEAVAKA